MTAFFRAALPALALACAPAASLSRDGFSLENASRLAHVLSVEIGPRPMGSPAERRALEFAAGRFREYGCDTAYVMPMEQSSRDNTSSGIAVGIKFGATRRIICIGGHIDSAGPDIPGANDDASGAATVIELSRVFARRQMQSTLLFCCWGGEERGLEGSEYFARHSDLTDSIAMMLQIDMASGLEGIDIDADSYKRNAPRWLVRAAIEEFGALGYRGLSYPVSTYVLNYLSPSGGAGSDHESFLKQGVPAIDFSTDVNTPIHTPMDNWENFDPRGMKRSGDVAERLVSRFDGGTPDRALEEYFLVLVSGTPFFFSILALRIFIGASFAAAAGAVIIVWRRRRPAPPSEFRWSGGKMLLLTFVTMVPVWFASDLIGLLKGVRNPWFTDVDFYILLSVLAAPAGVWAAAVLARRLRITGSPLALFAWSAIPFSVATAACLLLSTKLAVYPAAALILISLALLIPSTAVRVLLSALATAVMGRLIVPEWSAFLYRSFGIAFQSGSRSFINVVALTGLTLYWFPLFCGIASVVRSASPLNSLAGRLPSRAALALSLAVFCAMGAFLLQRPVFNRLWCRNIAVSESYNMETFKRAVHLSSPHGLSGVGVKSGGRDTVLTSGAMFAEIPVAESFDTTWVRVEREERKETSGATTTFDLEVRVVSMFRPLQITAAYSARGGAVAQFTTPLRHRFPDERSAAISWYSFPDTIVRIPVHFAVTEGDTVKERIDVVFDRLAAPVECVTADSYVTGRTTFTASRSYRP